MSIRLSFFRRLLKPKYWRVAYYDWKFREFKHPKYFKWGFADKAMNRIAVVNSLVAKRGGIDCRYLEIGCQDNRLFQSVFASKKTGVDPERGGTIRALSDDFFAENEKIQFDVIFIDGLHEYPQVRRDLINSLTRIPVGGFIGLHDLLPASWKAQHIPRIANGWNGDCWKISLELMQSKGIEFLIVDVDEGVGVVRKSSVDWEVPDLSSELQFEKFARFVDEVNNLPIVTFDQFCKRMI